MHGLLTPKQMNSSGMIFDSQDSQNVIAAYLHQPPWGTKNNIKNAYDHDLLVISMVVSPGKDKLNKWRLDDSTNHYSLQQN